MGKRRWHDSSRTLRRYTSSGWQSAQRRPHFAESSKDCVDRKGGGGNYSQTRSHPNADEARTGLCCFYKALAPRSGDNDSLCIGAVKLLSPKNRTPTDTSADALDSGSFRTKVDKDYDNGAVFQICPVGGKTWQARSDEVPVEPPSWARYILRATSDTEA